MSNLRCLRIRFPVIVLCFILAGLSIILPGVAPVHGIPGDPDPVGVWPLAPDPAVVTGFDPPAGPYGAGHRGVDLTGFVGQGVRSALPGRVTYAGRLAGRGVVVVSHGATRTTYEPVTAGGSVGDEVVAGARIGSLELAGSHCFPRACLHWGWLRGETYLDPLGLVGAGPIRLLPLVAPRLPAPAGPTTSRNPYAQLQRSPPPHLGLISGARVGLLVGATQPIGGDVGVQLGRGQ